MTKQKPLKEKVDNSTGENLSSLYKQWCRETKRNGAVLVGSSILEFFTWLEVKGYTLSNTMNHGN